MKKQDSKRPAVHTSASGTLLEERIYVDTQTIYHANGDVNIYPCSYELEKEPLVTGGPWRRRGRMTIEENGYGHFTPYREGTGGIYTHLCTTSSGTLSASPRSYYVRLRFPKEMSTCRMMEALMQQVSEICDYMKNNL